MLWAQTKGCAAPVYLHRNLNVAAADPTSMLEPADERAEFVVVINVDCPSERLEMNNGTVGVWTGLEYRGSLEQLGHGVIQSLVDMYPGAAWRLSTSLLLIRTSH